MATKVNLLIDQGASFSTSINLTNTEGDALDLTNYSGAAQLRKNYTSSNATSFNVSLSTGVVSLSMNSTSTSVLEPGRYVYDVILTDSSNTVSRIAEGIITVTPNVTR